ncbi:cytochrome P450 [Amycolatopsis sp. NPDC051758]|uniref:cytochrome P450 n=1 Tax=Amycolatopsis sp. NPDC051758 TaxID=3363935 RepID=UPI0037A6B04C
MTIVKESPSAATYTVGEAPGRVPLLGHVPQLWRRPLEFLTSLPAHGDLVAFRLGPRLAYIACHHDLVTQLLHDSRTFDKGGPLFEKARLLVGDGLVSSGFESHRRQRRLVQPAFHRARMPHYIDIMAEEIDAELSSWRPGVAFNVSDITHGLTLRITARTMFATRIGEDAVRAVTECMPVIMQGVYRRMISPTSLIEKIPNKHNRLFAEAQVRMRDVISDTVAEYRRSGADQGDVLSILVNQRDEETGEGLTDQEIHDQVMTVLIGGTETTGNTLAWTFHLLARHPEIEAKLQDEVTTVFGGRRPTSADLPRLEYTDRVLTETLRMYPPAWLLSRTTTRDVEIAGARLSAGTPVFYSSYLLGRNPEMFPDPDRYDPDRWLPERAKQLPRNAVLPFGQGNRKCIGDNFGIAETTLTLAAAVARWRLRPVPGHRISTAPKASLGTGPLPMVPEPVAQADRPAPPAAAAGCPVDHRTGEPS